MFFLVDNYPYYHPVYTAIYRIYYSFPIIVSVVKYRKIYNLGKIWFRSILADKFKQSVTK